MADDPAYILEVEGVEDDPPDPALRQDQGRRWIGVHFECCGVYTRIYRNAESTAYVGHCPRCTRQVSVRIGPGGTSHRMFRAH